MLVRIVLSARKATFFYPMRPAPRTAVLIAGFRSHGGIRVFPNGWTEEARRFEPQAIAASLPQLEALVGVASPTHAVIVLRTPWDPHLTEVQRAGLWKAYRVPAFEQIVEEDGTLLATECEAHDGLHIESARFIRRDHGVHHEVHNDPCACGRTTPRLRSPQRVEVARRLVACAR